MSVKLYDYQQVASQHLYESMKKSMSVLDASETGTGKTFTALEVARLRGDSPLIVCPKSVISAWRETAELFSIAPFDVVNIEKLKAKNCSHLSASTVKKRVRGKVVKEYAPVWNVPRGTMIIWDEAHNASGIDSQNCKVLAYTRAYGLPTLMLSATAAESPLKMRSIGYLLGLHTYDNHYMWCLRNGCTVSPWGNGALEFTQTEDALGHMKSLHGEIFPARGYRVLIEETDSFPENKVIAGAYDLGGDIDLFNKISEEMEEELVNPHVDTLPLTLLLRARQRMELLKVPLFIEMAQDALAEGCSPIVFFCFKESLFEFIKHIGITVSEVYGDQKSDRDEEIRKFQANETLACAATIGAGGQSISLHDKLGTRPRRTFISPSYSAREVQQALGRAHRAGGLSKVVQHIVFIADSVEQEACDAVRRKLDNISMLNDGDLSGGLEIEKFNEST